jgi:phosphatidylserine/phosphatidylglycerophosphate/cardiolipin synthase-like enzyme
MSAEAFRELSPIALLQLAAACREHVAASRIPSHAVQGIVGDRLAVPVCAAFDQLSSSGWRVDQIVHLLEQVAATRGAATSAEAILDLVLSGPEVDGVPTRETAAVTQELFSRAESEVLLVGYAVHGGEEVFRRLAERMRELPDLSVWMCLDIPRVMGDTSHPNEIVRRFVASFYERQWPWTMRPAIYYDARALSTGSPERTSLHAKCVVVDRRIALVTSANFTRAAQQRNIEVGVLIGHRPQAARLADYFVGLKAAGVLRPAYSAASGIR